MSVVGIEEDRVVVLLAHRPNERGNLSDAGKLALAFRDANHHGNLECARGGKDRVEGGKIGKIKMPNRHLVALSFVEYIEQGVHDVDLSDDRGLPLRKLSWIAFRLWIGECERRPRRWRC